MAGNHGNRKICVPSMLPHNVWLVSMGMKQNIGFQSKCGILTSSFLPSYSRHIFHHRSLCSGCLRTSIFWLEIILIIKMLSHPCYPIIQWRWNKKLYVLCNNLPDFHGQKAILFKSSLLTSEQRMHQLCLTLHLETA